MVGRIWHATATVDGADQYATHFREMVLPKLREVDGFENAYLLRREAGEAVEIRVLTLWSSLDAIREFAGDDLTTAVVEPQAQAVLTGYDSTVVIYDVAERGY